jgi:hypothetical protein
MRSVKIPTCFVTGVPTSVNLMEQGIQVQHANLGIDGSHWYHKILKF